MTCRPDHVMEEAHVHVRRHGKHQQGRALELPLPDGADPSGLDVLAEAERLRQQLERWRAETDEASAGGTTVP